ncbi:MULTISPECIES: tetratricopeptide repeat protein [unclassified Lentimicrobium]|uniref:tetratricopeptide repeat protein n=1 Tax=unclassified Lentimicrobium TaxID=2677434 RepID=UPI001557633D|nr:MULTISPECIES: tetratricopeptide repeat protein [unclassified Lentimicrobium]NPD46447.1 tetratricopeptide repeat protein [Lentimicrobium sp. S6]NPD84912.1 tetratricopeptide repeat protein [Lentimicrobium sp. L6]
MRLRVGFFLIHFLFLSFIVNASQIDSLKLELNPENKDTTYVKLLLQIADQMYVMSTDSMHAYSLSAYDITKENMNHAKNKTEEKAYHAMMALAISNIGSYYNDMGKIDTALHLYVNANEILEELGDKEGMGITLNNIGFIYNNFKVDIPKAIDYYEQSLACFEEINLDYGKAAILNNLAYIYDNQGDYKKALDYYFKALAIREKNNNKNGRAEVLNNIGAAYQDLGDDELAFENYTKSLKLKEEIKDSVGMGYSYNNIASIYMDMNDYEKALETHLLALKIRNRMGNPRQMAESYGNVGLVLTLMGNYSEAETNLKKSSELYSGLGVKDGEGYTIHNLGLNYYKEEDYQNALSCGRTAYGIASELGYKKNLRDASHLLYSIFKTQNQMDSALVYFEIYHEMMDSIKSSDNIKASVRMQTRYEIAQENLIKEQLLKEEEKIAQEEKSRRNSIQYTLIFIALLILAAAILVMGIIHVSEKQAQGLIFLTFLLFFEFLLVALDPWVDMYSGGAPAIKLGFNVIIAALIFPAHQYFEGVIHRRVIRKIKK